MFSFDSFSSRPAVFGVGRPPSFKMDPSESEDSDVDSLTPSLEAAMPPEQRLSTQERLRLARRRRSEQLKKWGQREREWQLHIAAQNHPRERNERITFVPNVMLLEAAARNDLEEGRPQQFFRLFFCSQIFFN